MRLDEGTSAFTAVWETERFHDEGFFTPYRMSVVEGLLRVEVMGAPALLIVNPEAAVDIYLNLTGRTLTERQAHGLNDDPAVLDVRLETRRGLWVRRYFANQRVDEGINATGHVQVWYASTYELLEHLVEEDLENGLTRTETLMQDDATNRPAGIRRITRDTN
jgi:hypothetical protein